MTAEPCGVELCPALAVSADGFCAVHVGAKRAGHVLSGTKCTACKRVIDEGDWITRASGAAEMTHAVCPPFHEWRGRKKDRLKPLLGTETT